MTCSTACSGETVPVSSTRGMVDHLARPLGPNRVSHVTARLVTLTATRLVGVERAHLDGLTRKRRRLTIHQALGAGSRTTAAMTDRLQLVDELGAREQVGHRTEWLRAKVGVETGSDYAYSALGQINTHTHDLVVKELDLVDADDVVPAGKTIDITGGAHPNGAHTNPRVAHHMRDVVPIVDTRLYDQHPLTRDFGPPQTSDELLALAAEHRTADHLDPAAVCRCVPDHAVILVVCVGHTAGPHPLSRAPCGPMFSEMSRNRAQTSLAVAAVAVTVAALVGQFVASAPEQLVTVVTVVALIVTLGTIVTFATVQLIGSSGAVRERTDLKTQALTDSLTGLRNTRAFHEDLARELAVANARGRSIGLVLLDLDGLKTVNDSAGHQAGDQLITALAETLRQSLRARDTAYRIGGDEFAVVLQDETTWGAFRFAQRLQGTFAARPAEQRLSAAAGVSASRGQTRDELIHEADLALIAAKRGRRGALIYTDDLSVREQGYDNPDRVDHRDLVSASLARAADVLTAAPIGNAESVAELAAQIASQLGSDRAQVACVRRAALLHNVGALVPGGPTDDVTRAILSADIARANGLPDEATWIGQQHENWDGTGGPDGRAGDDIPVASTIIRVATCFIALVDASDDPETARFAALDSLEGDAGVRFMPAAVEALRQVIIGRTEHANSTVPG